MLVNLIILVVLVTMSAFFSAAEIAFISLTSPKVDAMIKHKLPRANLIKKLKNKPRRLLVTILIGNNIVNIASASLATLVAGEIFQSAVLGITTGLMTVIVLVFGEIIPKSYAVNHNKKFAIFIAPILQIIQWTILPIVWFFEKLTDLFAGKHREEKVSEEELRALAYYGVKQGTIEHDERAMIERLFTLNDLSAEDIMTPRSNVICINQSLSIDSAADLISGTTHTRFPVINKSIDNIIGFVHSRDVLVALQRERHNDEIKHIIHPIINIEKDEKLDDLLREFQRENIHMAAVVHNGKTLGVVTLEDVIEEIVGEISDEHDRP